MVAYFKVQNNLFMAAGALAGCGAALLCSDRILQTVPGYMTAFVTALFIFAGVVAGRILSFLWASGTLKTVHEILYVKEDPEGFLRKFAPMVERVPQNTIEYVDGVCRLAFAWEALGEYDRGLEILRDVKPENLRLHRLIGTSLVANQRLRLFLLKKEEEQAERVIRQMEELKEVASSRAPAICANLEQCLRLARIWLSAQKGEKPEEEELDYIREEIALAGNPIHRKEMEQLLEQMEIVR